MSRTKGTRPAPRPKPDLQVIEGDKPKEVKKVQYEPPPPKRVMLDAWDADFLTVCLAKMVDFHVILIRWNTRSQTCLLYTSPSPRD